MKNITKWIACITLILCLILPTVCVGATDVAAVPTGFTSASDVIYKNVGAYVANWGARGEDATFLSTYAQQFYKGDNDFDIVSNIKGGTTQSNAPSSPLYSELQDIMKSAHTHETDYGETRYLYQYTDCVKNDNSQISSFYSGKMFGSTWDAGKTWNREHTWPNSKGDLSGNGENDIMMLRPTLKSENGSRSNRAYGVSSAYYNPNGESGGKYDLRGDVSRIILYQYVRWGCINTGSKYNPNNIFGTSGVIESLDVLLLWMEQDPVDTWEMGRNDAVQSITGTRNVFVDYPEYAWLLFGEECPKDLVTPSREADQLPDTPDKPDTPVIPDEPEIPDYVVADTVSADVTYKLGLVQPNVSATNVYYINGNMANTYYLGTVTDPEAALDVTLKNTNGGYYLCTTIGGNKKYINMVVSGTHVNSVYENTASTVYTFDSAKKVLISNVNGEDYWIGTRNDKNFTTVGPVKVSYNGFYSQLYTKNTRPETPNCETNGHIYDNEEDLFCNVCEMYKNLDPTLVWVDGVWKLYENGVWNTQIDTLHKLNGKWFLIKSGIWDKTMNGLEEYKGKTFFVKGGKWKADVTDLKWVDGKWYYIEDGKWNNTIDTLHKINGKWFLIKKGIWNKTTALVEYNGKTFLVKGGKWDSSINTLCKQGSKYVAIKNGKVYEGKGIIAYNGKNFYVNNGYAQLSYSGKVIIDKKTYKIKAGKVV